MTGLHRVFFRLGVAVATCVLTAGAIRAGDKKDSSQEFLKAIQLTDIRSPGSPPFELDAKVRIYGGDGDATPGTFKLIWVSPSEWREELSYNAYTRVRIGGKDEYWQQRSPNYEPLQVTELAQAIDFVSSLRDEKSPGKLKSRKESGVTLDCAEGSGRPRNEYCFDPAEGVLASEDVVDESPAIPYSFKYSDFREFGQSRFPGTIQVSVGKAPLADFSVERLVNIERIAPSDFVPPNGSLRWLTCSYPEKPVSVSRVKPDYPPQERIDHHQGPVLIYAVIATDGSLQNLQVLSAPSPGLAGAALAAVRQWRYKPRQCGDTPTPTETTIYVFFGLR
ncbi:MAG: TonB family protein [Candidatus Acidiferrales bacterium]